MTTSVIPGANFKIVTIPATAGNAGTNLKPALNSNGRIHAVRISLVCDATVVNRNIEFVHQGGGNHRFGVLIKGTNITASQTKTFAISSWRTLSGGITFPDDLDYALTDPIPVRDAPGSTEDLVLTVVIANGVVGDSYSGYYLLEEWSP